MEKAIKSLGQNFLKDKDLVKRMVSLLDIKTNFNVIEIGPGPGTFTTEIVKNIDDTNNFYAIELDKRFANNLQDKYKNTTNIHILNENFLDWARLIELTGTNILLGSIPYYITSPIIHTIIKMYNPPISVILMVQKEVAEKIAEKKVKPNYFSTFVKTFYDVNYIETVSRNVFTPVPNVDSAVIKLNLKQDTFGIKDIQKYENFLHMGFKHQKKMLNKSFKIELLEKIGLTGNERPHNLDVPTWINIYKELYNEI